MQAIRVLQSCVGDFNGLVERFQLQRRLERGSFPPGATMIGLRSTCPLVGDIPLEFSAGRASCVYLRQNIGLDSCPSLCKVRAQDASIPCAHACAAVPWQILILPLTLSTPISSNPKPIPLGLEPTAVAWEIRKTSPDHPGLHKAGRNGLLAQQ